MIYKFCEALFKRIREDKKNLLGMLERGSIKSMEEYKFIVGQMHGLERAEEATKRVADSFYGNLTEGEEYELHREERE